MLRKLENDWKSYKRALRIEDKKHFDKLFERAEQNADASSYMNTSEPFKAFLISVILEQEKEIHNLKQRKIEA